MAGGEFFHLLASLERQKKAEVDADLKLRGQRILKQEKKKLVLKKQL